MPESTSFLEIVQTLGIKADLFLAQAPAGFISFIISPDGILFLLVKILFIIIFFILLAAVIYFLVTTNYLQFRVLQDMVEFFTYKPYGVKRMTKIWRKAQKRLEVPDESEYKLAVIEADDLLDSILKRLGYAGNNLKERLSNITKIILPSIDSVCEAHAIRDKIVHDPDYHLTLDQAKKLLEVYEQALRELQALE